MAIVQEYVFKRIYAAIVEVRIQVGDGSQAGGIEDFEALGVAKTNVVSSRRGIGRRCMTARAIAALENKSPALDRSVIARAAKLIERRRKLERSQVGGERCDVFAGQRIFALHRASDRV